MNELYYDFNSKKKRGDFSLFLATFILIVIRYLYFGFTYFPQLDDYIQHHNYALLGSFSEVIDKFGLLGARPLAGILDITLWSRLWPCAIVGVLLLSALYAKSAVVFEGIFKKLFGTSEFFIIIYALLPLGIEGTYWMSASTRIIPGMFFAALSAFAFVSFMEKGQIKQIVLALLFQFITFCFYEQTAVLSCALNIILSLIYINKSSRRWIFSFTCILNAVLYFIIITFNSNSALYSGRTNIILPTGNYYFATFLPELLSQIKMAFVDGGFYTFFYGFIRGIMRIIADSSWLYIVFLVIATAFFGSVVIPNNSNKGQGIFIIPTCVAFVLMVAPLAPFFIIENPWFSLRGTVPSFVGIALAFDTLIRLLTNGNVRRIAIISSVTAFVFCMCSVSEISDYRDTTTADSKVVSALSKIAPDIRKETSDNCRVAVLNVDERYVTEQNFYYHEHIHGVTESDWALTGAVRCYNGDVFEGITYVPISLKDNPLYKKWEYASKSMENMQAVYVYDYKENIVDRLNIYSSGNVYYLYYSNGEKFGTVVENDDSAIFLEE